MKVEEKKRFLELYDTLLTEVMMIPRQIEDLRMSMLPNGVKYSDMPKSHSQKDLMASFAAQLDDLEQRYDDAVRGMKMLKDAIHGIRKPLEKRVVYAHYVRHETWYGIAKFEKMSKRGVEYACRRGEESAWFSDIDLVRRLLKRYGG